MAGVQERYAASSRLTTALLFVTAWGLLFTLWLTYLELFVIRAICRWCIGSAAMTVLLFGLALGLEEWRVANGEWRAIREEASSRN